jgi:serine protease Do
MVFTIKAQNLPELYNEVKSSVVIIKILNLTTQGSGDHKTTFAFTQQGSGVLISKEGLIWTAAHVVQSAEVVGVQFLDGDVYEAEVLSTNPRADVALIKIKDTFLLKDKKVATIGNSDQTLIGEDVFVIGAPFGLKQSLTKGILSGKHHPEERNNGFVYVEFLQTDAAINKGNSGGPMFNMKGEIIGITSSIYSALGEFNGVGFATSSNVAQKLLMETPNIWTGMESVLISGDLAKALNLPQDAGLLILRLSSNGIMSKLGLQGGTIPITIEDVAIIIGGDIILNIAGVEIADMSFHDLVKQKLETYKKGQKISITFLRNGNVEIIEFEKK